MRTTLRYAAACAPACGAAPSCCRGPRPHDPPLSPSTHTAPAPAPRRPQAKYFLTEAPADAGVTPRLLLGLGAWALGWATNLDADHRLINLRKPGEKGGRGAGKGKGGGSAVVVEGFLGGVC